MTEQELQERVEQYLESSYQDGAVMATRPNSGYHKRVGEFTDAILSLIKQSNLRLLESLYDDDKPLKTSIDIRNYITELQKELDNSK